MKGNCYATSEALYHILGGKNSGWKVMRIRNQDMGVLQDAEGYAHWYLQHKDTGIVLDASVNQFGNKKPPYHHGKHGSFYPVSTGMSEKARKLMESMTWDMS